MPASLGSLRPGAAFAYLVEITNRSRSAATRRPTIFSLSPPVYILAVSMKLPPASTKASTTGRQSSSDRDQSAPGPKVMLTSANFDTRRPLRPNREERTNPYVNDLLPDSGADRK